MGRRYRGSFIRATAPTTSNTSAVASGVWTLEQQMQAQQANQWPPVISAVCQSYTTAGCYTFVIPSGVTSISAVAIGGGGNGSNGFTTSFTPGTFYCCYYMMCEYDPGARGAYSGGGGGGGGFAYRNNYSVTAGQTLTITVGAGGTITNSQVVYLGGALVQAQGGNNASATGTRGNGGNGTVGDFTRSGGAGGYGYCFFTYCASITCYPPGPGGGGAGGYYNGGGNGANAGSSSCGNVGNATTGGGGGGGSGGKTISGTPTRGYGGGGGGGVGLIGNANTYQAGGAAGTSSSYGQGGAGNTASGGTNGSSPGSGGFQGAGGAGGSAWFGGSGVGRAGGVRIVAPGTTRQFPNTNV